MGLLVVLKLQAWQKPINPLDSRVPILQVGGDVCACEHIRLVYNQYTLDDNGLKLEDIQRTNHQDWG